MLKCFCAAVFGVAALSLAAADLRLEPTYHACGVYWKGETSAAGLRLEYRPSGGERWMAAQPLVASANKPERRASLLQLEENTVYDVRLLDGERELAKQSFRTASTVVPVARTVTLGRGPAKVIERGTPDGWVRVIVPVSGLDGGDRSEAAISIEKSAYVILERATVIGGGRHAVQVIDSTDIRIVNCDISGWGRIGKQDFRRRGVFYDQQKQLINNDAGVHILNSSGVTVERNYIHDPRGTANSWLYAHPAGPNAVFVKATGRTVIRYNDMPGSDLHRWNDAVEGNGNGDADGGLACDADVYGNLMMLGNDDGIELDGGQMNVRVWGNQFEGSLCGVSTAPCIYGPSYIWNNLFVRPGDEDGVIGSDFKNNYTFCGSGQINLWHNTMVYKDGLSPFGNGTKPRRYLESLNNVYACDRVAIAPSLVIEGNVFDYDLIWSDNATLLEKLRKMLAECKQEAHGVFAAPKFVAPEKGDFRLQSGQASAAPVVGLGQLVPQRGINGILPLRPTPLVLDRSHLDFSVLGTGCEVNVTAALSGGPVRRFRVLKNAAYQWFEVTPAAGELQPGAPVTLRVRLKQNLPPWRYKGVFLVKLDDGFSRPVTVYAGEAVSAALTASTPGCAAVIEAESAAGGHPYTVTDRKDAEGGRALLLKAEQKDQPDPARTAVYRFTVPADGWYYLAARFRPTGSGGISSFHFAIDGGTFGMTLMRYSSGWCWAGITDRTNKKLKGWFEPVKLTAGEHRLAVAAGRDELLLDTIAVLTDPRAVRPRQP